MAAEKNFSAVVSFLLNKGAFAREVFSSTLFSFLSVQLIIYVIVVIFNLIRIYGFVFIKRD